MTHPLLAIDNLSIAFRQQGETQTVVHNLSLEVAVGETLALVGESGSGKSISALSVLRLLPTPPASYPSGDIRFHGQSLLHADEATLRGVRGNRIAMIFQEPMVSLNPLHTLEKQLYEVLSLHRGMRKEAARGEISGGERQRVMIAMALLTRPELLIADEPTTALDVSVQAQILQLLRELKRELNMGMLFITHNLSIVRQLADRVAVMQNGRCVEHNHCRALFSAPAHPYTQRLLDSEPDGEPVPLAVDAPVLLQVDDLNVAFPVRKGILRRVVDHHRVVNSLSFQLRAGEVFQDPNSSLNPRLTAQQIIEEGLRVHQPTLTAVEREQAVILAMQEVGLDPASRQRYPAAFSGGQRQRIAIARALIVKPQLIVLDEPTSSLDKTVQAQILNLLKALQLKHQLAYIFISHDLGVVRALCHQVMVLRQGMVVEQGECQSVFSAPRHEYTRQLLALS